MWHRVLTNLFTLATAVIARMAYSKQGRLQPNSHAASRCAREQTSFARGLRPKWWEGATAERTVGKEDEYNNSRLHKGAAGRSARTIRVLCMCQCVAPEVLHGPMRPAAAAIARLAVIARLLHSWPQRHALDCRWKYATSQRTQRLARRWPVL